jgi:23S rRNA pseudouridine2605 synthase
MPKRNSSSSAGRRGASRTNSRGKSFSSKGKSSDKPFKKTNRRDTKSAPFSREDKDSSPKRRSSTRTEPPFKKFDKPYRKKEDDSSTRSGGYGKRDSSARPSRSEGSSRPYKKSEKPFNRKSDSSGGSYRRKDDDSSTRSSGYGKRDSSSSRSSRSEGSSRPYKKSEKPFKRKSDSSGESYRKKEGDSSARGSYEKRGSSSARSSRSESSSRPFKKYEKPFNEKTDSSEESSKRPAVKRGRFSAEETPRKSAKPFERRSDDRRSGQDKRGKAFDKPGTDFKSAKSKPRISEETEATSEQSTKIRLNKFISNSGVCSRREADELITMGLITVNGKTITELGYKVNPDDEVRHEEKILRAEKPVYVLLNKPKGYITTTDDPNDRKTVMQIIGRAVKERIYPVGRLDRNTTGLLLLTNDGDLADKLMHPSYNVKKIYKVELDRPLTKGDAQSILDGVRLEEGKATVDDIAIVSDDGKTVGIELHIGWNRVVRRIFESLDYTVVKLDRSVYAGLDKKDLSRGEWRFLTREEVVHLKHFK